MADAKQGKTPNEDFHNGPSQSRVVLAKPRLGGFGPSSFGSSSSKGNSISSVLRPPQLKPSSNAFLKAAETPDESDTTCDKTETPSENRLEEPSKEEVPKFVPLGTTNVSPRTNTVPVPQAAAGSSSGFVFGQNLSDRVVMSESANNGDAPAPEHGSTNGTSELLFSSAAASVKDNSQEKAGPSDSSGGGGGGSEGLAAAAAEYERSHARPPPLPANIVTMTGEEDEVNVLQISCRLFAWESGSWRERGRGLLRLNDSRHQHLYPHGGGSRLVIRAVGSLRVAINTMLWPEMVVERAGFKSLRISAFDAQNQAKLFLIMGTPGDMTQLYRTIMARIAAFSRLGNIFDDSKPSTFIRPPIKQKTATNDSENVAKHDEDSKQVKEEESSVDDVKENESDKNERLEAEPTEKTDETESLDVEQDKESKLLKRKEPVEDETLPKRQCPDIVIE